MISYQDAKRAWLEEILSEKLQPIEDGFLGELSSTLAKIENTLSECQGKEPRRSLLEAEKLRMEKFLGQLIRIRTAKLLSQAAEGKRPKALTETEKKLFENVSQQIECHEKRFYKIPEEEEGSLAPEVIPEQPPERPDKEEERADSREISQEPPDVEADRNRIIAITSDFPRFVGPDLREYGPFKGEDLVSVPDEVSEIILNRNIGRQIESGDEN